MLEKLINQFPNSVIVENEPLPSNEYHWFRDENTHQFIGIPKEDLSDGQLELLKVLFPHKQPTDGFQVIAGQANAWYEFLFKGENSPLFKNEFRVIQFYLSSPSIEVDGLGEALENIFEKPAAIGMLSSHQGFIIEEKTDYSISNEELASAIEAFEGDFYTNSLFYIGSFHQPEDFRKHSFEQEQKYFRFAQQTMLKDKVVSFDKVLPVFLVKELRENPSLAFKSSMDQVLSIFQGDPGLFLAIKKYIENHNNTSLTAKQLYLHRNSLQYRVEKFTDSTGIDLKSYSGTLAVYLACLEYEYFKDEQFA
ncbi:PucR family transcriptional regulator [Falsibacillus pallidus]|uniref:PucR family transcriptional regulator n=1 Tax=Falsibacillus pallidus TaxID=493781 RepID=UPI003D98A6B7